MVASQPLTLLRYNAASPWQALCPRLHRCIPLISEATDLCTALLVMPIAGILVLVIVLSAVLG